MGKDKECETCNDFIRDDNYEETCKNCGWSMCTHCMVIEIETKEVLCRNCSLEDDDKPTPFSNNDSEFTSRYEKHKLEQKEDE